MATFIQTLNPTPFGLYDSDPQFRSDADKMIVFVKRMLGDDVLSVTLTSKQIWACFEQAVNDFGMLVNQYQAVSQIATFLGMPTGSFTGSLSGAEQKNPAPNLEFLMRQAEPYSMYAGLGGLYNSASGSIDLIGGQQDYDLYTDLKDTAGVPLAQSYASGSRMRIGEVFHFSPSAAFRFFDSTSAINYLNNEFGFESFTPETIFYVLPVFEDILRAGQMDVSQRVRRSNYSYQIVGTKIRIFPAPTTDVTGTRKLWIRVYRAPDPLNPDVPDPSIFGVSNLSNIPFGPINYSGINPGFAHQWIRKHCLALCMEVLGRIRRKYTTIPIPGRELTLDGDVLLEHARADQEKLREELKLMLDNLTFDKIIEREADKAEDMQRQLRMVPVPGGPILMG